MWNELRAGLLGGLLVHALCARCPSPARAAPPAPTPTAKPTANIDDCEGLEGPRGAKAATPQPLGRSGPAEVQLVGRALAILHPEDEDEATSGDRRCEVFRLDRPRAQVKGRFGAQAAQVQAVHPTACTPETCPLALVVRDRAGKPLSALRAPAHCDAGVSLAPIKLFPDRDGLQVTCRRGAGAGYDEQRLLLATAAGGDPALRLLLAADTGSQQAVSAEERRAGGCASRPVGWIRVRKVGPRPVVRVFSPREEDMEDGRGTSPAFDYTFDPQTGRMERTGEGIPTAFDAFGACRRRR